MLNILLVLLQYEGKAKSESRIRNGSKQRTNDIFLQQLMQQPFTLGFHWWQWADEPSSGRWPDGEDSNYGLVRIPPSAFSPVIFSTMADIDDDEYQVLTQEMTSTNAQLDQMHAASYKMTIS